MDWYWILFAVVFFIALILLKRLGLVDAKKARELLANGAVVVDVRSVEEFRSRHLPGAVNIPLQQLHEDAPRRLPQKDQVLLLHCLSGTRSGMARRTLKNMGYTLVYNIGSYHRAAQILKP